MSKENITEIERLITKLQKVREDSELSESNRMFAASLLAHYMEYKSLTFKQTVAASNLVKYARPKRKPKKKDQTYYLYAIVGGENVKLGVSTNPKNRLKALQTGNREHLKIYWTYRAGSGRQAAYTQEKKLHRFCKKYRVRGEWFTNECLPLLAEFKVK